MAPVPYSPLKDDLLFPCRNAQFFATGAPRSDAELCAELSRLAYCRSTKTFSMDRERVSTVLRAIGLRLTAVSESRASPDGRGTHCFIASRDADNLLVVSFRGTDGDDATDVAHDADGLPIAWDHGRGNVHRGFRNALNDVLADVLSALQRELAAPGCRLLFTGHSLGAALATLLASIKAPSALYTFGSPLVGDEAFVASLAAVENYRYVDCCDIVTRVPPAPLGYRHLGDPYYIARDRSISFNPGDEFIKNDRLEAFLEYPVKYEAWRQENVGVRELADHSPINYVWAIYGARDRS